MNIFQRLFGKKKEEPKKRTINSYAGLPPRRSNSSDNYGGYQDPSMPFYGSNSDYNDTPAPSHYSSFGGGDFGGGGSSGSWDSGSSSSSDSSSSYDSGSSSSDCGSSSSD